jgi:PAS domain S-box-containing protein
MQDGPGRPIDELELAGDAVIACQTDLFGRIVFVNRAFVEVSGYDAARLIGASLDVIRHPDMPEQVFDDLWARVRHGRSWQGVLKNRRPDGEAFWLRLTVTPAIENDVVTSCLLVGSRATPQQIEDAEAAHARLGDPAGGGGGFWRRLIRSSALGTRMARMSRSLNYRMGATFAVLLALLMMVDTVGYFGMRSSTDALNSVYEDRTQVIVQATKIGGPVDDNFTQISLLRDAMSNPEEADRILTRIAENDEAITAQIARLRRWSPSDETKSVMSRFATAAVVFERDVVRPAFAAGRTNDMDALNAAVGQTMQAAYTNFTATRTDLFSAEIAAAGRSYQTSQANIERLVWLAAGFLAAGLVVSVVLSRALMGSILGATRRMKAYLVEIASGRLGTEIPDEPIREFREINDAVRALEARLRFTAAERLEHGEQAERRQRAHETQLEAAKEAAEAADRAKSAFLATMSHELRTPLTGVLGMIDLLKSGTAPNQAAFLLKTMESSAKALVAIVGDILDFSKIEAGQLELERTVFSVSQTVQSVIDLYAHVGSEKGVAVKLAPGAGMDVYVHGDPTRLRQVLANFVSNAVKFTQRGSVTVRVMSPSDAASIWRFEVQDTGMGISPQAREQLFSPFMQADTSITRRFGGSGLGLAICRRLVELMGGRIGVDSELGRGSTFWIELPMEPVDEETARIAAREEERAPSPGTARTLDVLVAEDNPTNRILLDAMLTRLGHRCVCVEDGQQALDTLVVQQFDVLITDIQMPVLDGEATTRALRRMAPPLGTIPIVGLTADAVRQHLEAYKAAGMDYVLTKPIDPLKIRQTLDAIAAAMVVLGEAVLPPLLDVERIEALGGLFDTEGVAALLRTTVAEAQRLGHDLSQAAARNDVGGVRVAVDSLRGMAGDIGASRLQEMAERLQRAVEDGTAWQSELSLVLDVADETMSTIRRELARLAA